MSWLWLFSTIVVFIKIWSATMDSALKINKTTILFVGVVVMLPYDYSHVYLFGQQRLQWYLSLENKDTGMSLKQACRFIWNSSNSSHALFPTLARILSHKMQGSQEQDVHSFIWKCDQSAVQASSVCEIMHLGSCKLWRRAAAKELVITEQTNQWHQLPTRYGHVCCPARLIKHNTYLVTT